MPIKLKKLSLLFICIVYTFSFSTTYAISESSVKFISIASGNSFTMAIAKDGTLWSWGDNFYGQLGDGTKINRSYPKKISGISDVIKVSCGEKHVIALKKDGTVWTWGKNYDGELGNCNIQRNTTIPVKVKVLKNIVDIAGGSSHSLALSKYGTIWGWGRNIEGQLASIAFNKTNTPKAIKNLPKIKYISSKYEYSMAISTDGKVFAWGDNSGASIEDNKPITITYFKNVVAINTLKSEAIFLLKDGTVWRYVYKNNSVQVEKIENLSNIKNISGGADHIIALKKDGTVWTYGTITSIFLVTSSENENISANQVNGLKDIVSIGAGNESNFAINKNNTILAWGSNCSGQLGLNTALTENLPIKINALSNIIKVCSNQNYSIAIDNKGSFWQWGDDYLTYDKLGTNTARPRKKDGLLNITSGTCSSGDALAYNTEGDLWAWGVNIQDGYAPIHFNFKDNPIIDASSCDTFEIFNILQPDGSVWCSDFSYGTNGIFKIEGLPIITKLASFSDYNFAVAVDGTVWNWGNSGDYGRIDDGMMFIGDTPQKITNLANVISIDVRYGSIVILKSDGTVWTLDINMYGQNFDSYQIANGIPTKIESLSDITAIASGGGFNLALKSDGTVWSWGCNSDGELGDGTYVDKSIPVRVKNLKNITSIDAGNSHSLAIDNSGNVYSWGANNSGQLGNGVDIFVTNPTPVNALVKNQ